MRDQSPSPAAAASHTMPEYITLFDECEYTAARLLRADPSQRRGGPFSHHIVYRRQCADVAAVMSIPPGATNASTDHLHRLHSHSELEEKRFGEMGGRNSPGIRHGVGRSWNVCSSLGQSQVYGKRVTCSHLHDCRITGNGHARLQVYGKWACTTRTDADTQRSAGLHRPSRRPR
jgi:hypothetical protein